MAATLIAQERAAYERQPETILRNVERALSSLPWLNDDRENARLAAVRAILKERRRR